MSVNPKNLSVISAFFLNIAAITIIPFLNGCGFHAYNQDNNQDYNARVLMESKIICISDNKDLCFYFKNALIREIRSDFDGILEVTLSSNITKSDPSSLRIARLSTNYVNIEYTYVPASGMVSFGRITRSIEYEFTNSLISDFASNRTGITDIIDNSLTEIKYAIM